VKSDETQQGLPDFAGNPSSYATAPRRQNRLLSYFKMQFGRFAGEGVGFEGAIENRHPILHVAETRVRQ